MDKTILIVTDLSKKAWNALNYVTSLYKDFRCTFLLLNFNLPEDNAERAAKDNGSKIPGEQLKRILTEKRLSKDHNNHDFKSITNFNSISETIQNTKAEMEINLIVLGTPGSGILYESHNLEIVQKFSEMPVLLIPENSSLPEGILREILLAVDLNKKISKKSLEPLLEIASQYNSVIRILNINKSRNTFEEQKINKEHLGSFLAEIPHSFHSLRYEKTVPGIYSNIESRGSNLLALVNSEENLLSGLFSEEGRPLFPILVLK